MPENDSLNIGETDAGSLKILLPMQPLKDAEKFLGVLHVESDAIVANKNDGFVFLAWNGADFDFSLGPGASEFQRIGQEIHQDLAQHGRVAKPLSQSVDFPGDIPVFNFIGHIVKRGLDDLVQIEGYFLHFGTGRSREIEQVVD